MQSNVDRSYATYLDLKFPNVPVCRYNHSLHVSGMEEVLKNVSVSKWSSIVFIFPSNPALNELSTCCLHSKCTGEGQQSGEALGVTQSIRARI